MADYLNGDIAAAEMGHLFSLPEAIEKIISPSRSHESKIPVDILDTSNQYIFYMDLPGLSKSDIQVSIEDENALVIRSNGKRKREDGEEGDVCKYIRLERRAPQKLVRKFKLPENCNLSAIAAKCENGVLTVVVEKLPPPPKSKIVTVAIS